MPSCALRRRLEVSRFHRSPRGLPYQLTVIWLATTMIPIGAIAGNIVLSGHDDDLHTFYHSSSNAAAQASAMIAFARSGAPNPSLPVLAFDHGPELTSLLASLGIPFTNVDPNIGVPDASLFDVTRFSAIVVASDTTCGGCDNDSVSSANLAAAKTAIEIFFGRGGGIVAFAGAANTSYYNFVPASASGFGNPPSTGYVQGPLGAALGIPPVNGDPTHNFFFTPGTNGVSAAYGIVETLGVNGQIETIACQGCGAAELSTFLTFLGTPGSPTNPTASFAEPVNTAIGNYFTSHTDLVVRGRGFPLRFTRHYNSRDPYTGPLGAGWTHNYNILLTIDPVTAAANVKQEDGSVITYGRTANGSYSPSTIGVFDQLRQNGDGSFALTRKDQTILAFSSRGQLTTITDRNGNTQRLAYDVNQHLIAITDTVGRVFTFSNDTANRITTITDPTGRQLKYSYDAAGNLISYTDALGQTTQYAYDTGHHLLTAIDPRHITYVQNLYDGQGRVTNQTNARGFVTTFAYNTPIAGTTSITDPRGNITKHVYDNNLRLVQAINPQGGTISYAYDASNERIAVTNENGNTIKFSYDLQGNLLTLTNPLGDTARFTYDTNNNLLTTVDPKGNPASMSYDTQGNLIQIKDALNDIVTMQYDANGEVTAVTNSLGKRTGFTYDTLGNVIRVTNPLGYAETMTYDAASRLTSVVDQNGNSLSFTFDPLNRVLTATDALGNVTKYQYDGSGNLTVKTDPRGNATAFQRDASNNLIGVTDALGVTTKYTFDENGNQTTITTGNGNTMAFSFNSLNRLTMIQNPLGYTRSYAYDQAGNLTSLTDENGQTHSFAYDAMNRRTTAHYADGTAFSFSYDANGNRMTLTDPSGNTQATYDALNRLTSVSDGAGNIIKYAYSGVGQRTSVTYPDGRTVSYGHDDANRLTQVTDWAGRKTIYSYDPAGNLIGAAFPNGTASVYGYNKANQLISVSNLSGLHVLSSFTYSLDQSGNRLLVVDGASGTSRYSYDAVNRLTNWTAPSGQSTSYSYDNIGNRISIVSSSGTTLYSYDAADELLTAGTTTFTYDRKGNQTSKTTPTATTTYAFDSLDRLASATLGTAAVRFQYDGDGVRTSRISNGILTQYANDTLRRFPTVLSENGPNGLVDYDYGTALISATAPTFELFYQSDALGSIASMTDQTGALKANLMYDPWGKTLNAFDPVATKNSFKFTGEAIDPVTGLYYLRGRFYDPQVGRFISKDRFPGFTSEPLTENGYAYAGDNPLKFSDHGGDAFGADDGIALMTGAIGGFVGQYLSDVAQNIDSGATGLDIFVPNHSWQDYAVSTVGGAITADLGLNGFELGGPVGAGVGAAAGTGLTDVVKSWVDGSSVDFGKVAVDSAVAGLTGGLLETFPHVPGSLPNWFSDSFFVGAHATDAWVKAAVGAAVGFTTSLLTGLTPSATDLSLGGFTEGSFQFSNALSTK